MCYVLKKWIYFLPTFQNITQSMKNKSFFFISMTLLEERRHYLAVKDFSIIKRNNIKKYLVIFVVWIVFIRLEQKTNVNHIKKYAKIKIFVML